MEFDEFSIVLLTTAPDAPELDESASRTVFDGHLSYLATAHDDGHLIGAGPTRDESLRGVSVVTLDPDRARAWAAADPAVRAGVFSVQIVPWRVPRGAVAHAPARFPRSVAEASS